ncbi:MAG: hypothetical protein JNK15_17395 [Planctomycetes bacterium]|nr:hypothetical protein [Planctomycetota bacterium]
MRGLGLVLSLVLLLALLTALWLGTFGSTDDLVVAPTPQTPTAKEPKPVAEPGPRPGPAVAIGSGNGLVASRVAVTPPPNKNLADQPTAFVQVVDHGSGRPIAGAPLRTVLAGHDIAFTDERGIAPIALREPEQLAVVVAGYLLRLVPTRLGTTENEPQVVRLVRDEWSFRRRFEFAGAGTGSDEVFVRFRPQGQAQKPNSPVPATDAVRTRAWSEHTMLATRPVCADVPVQLGTWSEDRVHRLRSGSEVRFLTPGEFQVEAATTGGHVATTPLRIAAEQPGLVTVRIELRAGAYLDGRVSSAHGEPLANTRLLQQGGDPLGLVATTAADGTFRFGPLPNGPVTLHVRHGDHEPLAFGPTHAPATDVRITLQPLPRTSLRGRVRARPRLQPLAGATVVWSPPAGAPVNATTDADGIFVLPATGDADARLTVQAIGFVPWSELLAPGAPFAEFDLWPADTRERTGLRLTAVLAGTVADATGGPVVDATVRWQPNTPEPPAGTPGRRVLTGASLDLPPAVRTGADGAFSIETTQFGPGRLVLVGTDRAIAVDAVAGQTKNDLRLQP